MRSDVWDRNARLSCTLLRNREEPTPRAWAVVVALSCTTWAGLLLVTASTSLSRAAEYLLATGPEARDCIRLLTRVRTGPSPRSTLLMLAPADCPMEPNSWAMRPVSASDRPSPDWAIVERKVVPLPARSAASEASVEFNPAATRTRSRKDSRKPTTAVSSSLALLLTAARMDAFLAFVVKMDPTGELPDSTSCTPEMARATAVWL
ncbi:hypothetical protein V8C86DRAFT_2507035 [Haematococcus lacustris]